MEGEGKKKRRGAFGVAVKEGDVDGNKNNVPVLLSSVNVQEMGRHLTLVTAPH